MMTDWYRKVLKDYAAGLDPAPDYTPDMLAAWHKFDTWYKNALKDDPNAVFTIPQDTEGLPG